MEWPSQIYLVRNQWPQIPSASLLLWASSAGGKTNRLGWILKQWLNYYHHNEEPHILGRQGVQRDLKKYSQFTYAKRWQRTREEEDEWYFSVDEPISVSPVVICVYRCIKQVYVPTDHVQIYCILNTHHCKRERSRVQDSKEIPCDFGFYGISCSHHHNGVWYRIVKLSKHSFLFQYLLLTRMGMHLKTLLLTKVC